MQHDVSAPRPPENNIGRRRPVASAHLSAAGYVAFELEWCAVAGGSRRGRPSSACGCQPPPDVSRRIIGLADEKLTLRRVEHSPQTRGRSLGRRWCRRNDMTVKGPYLIQPFERCARHVSLRLLRALVQACTHGPTNAQGTAKCECGCAVVATAQDKNIPEQQRERFHPPLYIAVKKHDIALVVQMLQEGIDPNDPAEWTPLFMGAGARSGMRGPLHFSSIYQAFDIAKALLTNENGPVATVDAVDAQGHTALYYAALNGNVALAKLLLAHGADYTQYKQCRNDCNLPSPPPVPSP